MTDAATAAALADGVAEAAAPADPALDACSACRGDPQLAGDAAAAAMDASAAAAAEPVAAWAREPTQPPSSEPPPATAVDPGGLATHAGPAGCSRSRHRSCCSSRSGSAPSRSNDYLNRPAAVVALEQIEDAPGRAVRHGRGHRRRHGDGALVGVGRQGRGRRREGLPQIAATRASSCGSSATATPVSAGTFDAADGEATALLDGTVEAGRRHRGDGRAAGRVADRRADVRTDRHDPDGLNPARGLARRGDPW